MLTPLKTTKKYSVRVQGISTSISLRTDIISLWAVLHFDPAKDISHAELDEDMLSFIYTQLEEWNTVSAKGLSIFITEALINDILDPIDHEQYRRIRNLF